MSEMTRLVSENRYRGFREVKEKGKIIRNGF